MNLFTEQQTYYCYFFYLHMPISHNDALLTVNY